jgi:heptosyltransferase-3
MHRVRQMLQLAEAIGIAPVGEVVPPAPVLTSGIPDRPFAIVHAAPMFHYKRWSVDGWRALASALKDRGLQVVATGGPAERERQYLDAVWGADGQNVVRRDGQLGWRELTGLLDVARVYVGPDTSVTHLAAATGTPTVALYGPTDPVLWGPWPQSGLETPWAKSGALQQRGNVWLVQQGLPCVPCQLEGCERGLGSYSRCLDELALPAVLGAIEAALAAQPSRRAGAAIRTPV